jgi:Arc/MetJ family transcription regulator
MRTNIVLDEDLLAKAMQYSTARTKRAVIHEALATYVTEKAEQQRIAAYRKRLAPLRERLAKTPARISAQTLVRADRNRAP